MDEETVVAAPSAAEETPATPEFDHSRGALVDLSPEQRSEYKKTGVLPKAPEPKADPAPAPKKETPSDTEPEADAGTKQQEKPKEPVKRRLDAQGRVRELRTAIEQEWEKETPDHDKIARFENTIDKIEGGQKRKTEPAPVAPKQDQPTQAPPANYEAWEKRFIEDEAGEWMQRWINEHPDKPYESANAAMAAYMRSIERQYESVAAQNRAIEAKVSEAKAKYGARFDEIIEPATGAIMGDKDIPMIVKQRLARSEHIAELMLAIGNDLPKFVSAARSDAFNALDYIAYTESLIREELESKAAHKEPKADPPAKPQTSAPKPPSEVGGRAASPGDELESAAKANDYRRFSAESTRRALAAMKR